VIHYCNQRAIHTLREGSNLYFLIKLEEFSFKLKLKNVLDKQDFREKRFLEIDSKD